jgi:DMSO reductase family type II enzyme chaperone
MEMKASSLDQKVGEVDLALCRATLYGALALGFRAPTEETVERLLSEEGAGALAEAAGALDTPGASTICAAALRLSGGKRSLPALSDTFLRLFGHTASGPVPPYETEYGAEALFQQPQEMGDLAGFYSAFGLAMNPAEHERSDHVSCECEFLCFLALKEAYALESDDIAMLEEVRKATRLFVRDHLGRFVPAFARKLVTEGQGTFYGALGELCLSFITDECARLGVAPGAASLGLRPAADDRVPMACGSGAACAMPGVCDPEENVPV